MAFDSPMGYRRLTHTCAPCAFRIYNSQYLAAEQNRQPRRCDFIDRLRQLEGDLFYVDHPLPRRAPKTEKTTKSSRADKSDGKSKTTKTLDYKRSFQSNSTKTGKESTSKVCSPTDSNQNQNLKTAKSKTPNSKTASKNSKLESRPTQRAMYGTWQAENELKLTLKSLMDTIKHFRALHFLAPQSKAADVVTELNSMITLYNELKTKYNACHQQRWLMGRKLRNIPDADKDLQPVSIGAKAPR
ncbi:hypothetical protein M3Y94_00896400 [Aphelenchoides besseyi]|nr:hypothetical protein M3Y94_00896400 [Aphelenchoides besseyi]KAI6223394.1 hypothetical protein M3Y95_00885500 [Aphelenchoides besseyi]